jgi:molybdopterin-guanine dinucleotide biosynthesis protein
VDIVLVEGYKNGSYSKVMVLDDEGNQPILGRDEELLATVSGHRSS